jgi:ATP synthase subunit 6
LFIYSPLEGFKVLPLIPIKYCIDFSLTNIALSAAVLMFLCISLAVALSIRRKLIPEFPQLLIENIYEASITLIASAAGRRGMQFFPYFFSLYCWLALTNLLGGVPYSSVVTAQLIITAGLGFSTFIGLVMLFVYYHKWYFLSAFLPSGAPLWISPLLVVIELVSFIFRPISLSVRLFANIMAGHTLIVIITAFGYKFLNPISRYTIVSMFIFCILFCIIIIETAVQLIQAYVFTLLACNYLNNTMYLDH